MMNMFIILFYIVLYVALRSTFIIFSSIDCTLDKVLYFLGMVIPHILPVITCCKQHIIHKVDMKFRYIFPHTLDITSVNMLAAMSSDQLYTCDSWCIDSGASIHICCKREMFDSFTTDTPSIRISGVSNNVMYTKGKGTVRLPVIDVRTDTIHSIVLKNVYYLPNQPHNLISVHQVLNDYKMANTPDFKKFNWKFGSLLFEMEWKRNMYRLKSVNNPEDYDPENIHIANNLVLASVDKYKSETLQLSKAELSKYALLYTEDGRFDYNLFGLPTNLDNGHFKNEIRTDAGRDNISFNQKSFYGFVPPNLSVLHKTLEKSHNDFMDKPQGTTQLLVVPYLPTSNSWYYAKYYEILHVYPQSNNDELIIHKDEYHLFSHLISEDKQPIPVGNNGPKDYVYLPNLPFQYAVLYRDESTPMQTDDYVKCHLRFGHRSALYIRDLLKKKINLGKDIRLTESNLKDISHLCHCESCILTRMRRPSFTPNPPNRYEHLQPFEYIVSDVSGPISPQAADGSNYVVHFTCVKTRYTWGANMKSRSDVLYYFSQFLDFVKQSGYSVDRIRFLKTDNAGEYSSPEFKNFCNVNTIKKIFSSAYMHEENGMAEVIFREIAAVARAMLLTAELPSDLWHLAYDHSFWLRARMPNISNDMKIPFVEIFPNKTLDLEDVRVFGCKAYSWLDRDQRYNQFPDVSRHLHNRSRPLIYVGHSDTSASWLLYDIDRQQLLQTGRPRFIEEFDKYGRRINNPIMDSVFDSISQYKQLPSGFKDTYNLGQQKFTVSDHSIHFDDNENEMTCIIKVHTQVDQSGTWTYIHNVIQNPEQYGYIIEYLENFYSHGNLNSFYPLFSVCSAKPQGFKRSYQCILSSIDLALYSDNAYEGNSLSYGVVFNPKHGFDLGITAVSRNMLTFTDITSFVSVFGLAANQTDQLTKYLGYVPPNSYLEALTYPDAEFWISATNKEMEQMIDMGVFEFLGIDFDPKGKSIIDTRMVYVLKIIKATGQIDKYKARLVARGFRQTPGVDYDETYSPATALPIIRTFYVTCLYLGLKLHAMDIKGAFLQSPLKHEIYIRLPEGYTAFGGAKYAKLKKSMYGLKQAAHDWYKLQDKFLTDYGYKRSTMDRCLYVYNHDNVICIAYVHVDDYLFGCNSDTWYNKFLEDYSKYTHDQGDVDDLGPPLNHMQIALDYSETENTVSLNSKRYIMQTLARFGLSECKTKRSPLPQNLILPYGDTSTCEDTYRAMIGCLLWIARTARPDIQFAVTFLSQFVTCCTDIHLKSAKHILRYLAGSLDRIIKYTQAEMIEFVGQKLYQDRIFKITIKCDSDFASDSTDHKSFSGFLIFLNGFLVDWITRKQSLTATSTSEAEYISLSEASKAALHLFQLLSEFFIVETPITVLCDSKSAIAMAENNLSSRRTKHIWIVYRFVTDWINRGLLKIFHIGTKDNLADFMTKVPKDVNYLERSSLLFKSMISWFTEVVCYETTLDESKTVRTVQVAADAERFTVCQAMKSYKT